ncbi:MAG: hypothetical protein ABIO65_03145 [Nitrospiria bacterium]
MSLPRLVSASVLSALMAMAWPAVAAELPSLYRGIRPMGMGGAFITLSDDANAPFYNPAGLNDVRKWEVDLINPLVEWSPGVRAMYQDLQDLNGQNIVQVAQFLNANVGEFRHVRAAATPSVVLRNFAIVGLGQATMDLEIRNPVFPEVAADLRVDTGALIAGAFGIRGRMLQIGATAEFINRQGLQRTYNALDVSGGNFDPADENLEQAADVAFGAGVKFNPRLPLSPTFALVVQHIGDLDFDALGVIPQQYNAGFALNPSWGPLGVTLAAQVDDLTHAAGTDDNVFKRTRLGVEARFPKILSLRAGAYQGYTTAGATLDFWLLKLDAATYAEELGLEAGQRPNRRYMAQVTVGF